MSPRFSLQSSEGFSSESVVVRVEADLNHAKERPLSPVRETMESLTHEYSSPLPQSALVDELYAVHVPASCQTLDHRA